MLEIVFALHWDETKTFQKKRIVEKTRVTIPEEPIVQARIWNVEDPHSSLSSESGRAESCIWVSPIPGECPNHCVLAILGLLPPLTPPT